MSNNLKSDNKIVGFITEPLILSTILMLIYGIILFEFIYPLNNSFLFSIGLPIMGILFIDFFIKFGSMAILCLLIYPFMLRKSRSEIVVKLNPFKWKKENTTHGELGITSFFLQLISFLSFGFVFGTLSINFTPLLEQPYISSEITVGWFLFVLALLPGIFEELVFREYIFRLTLSKYSKKFTILSNGILFGIFHIFGRLNDPFTAMFGMVFIALPYGIALAYLRLASKSVIPCILMHYLTDSLLLFLLYGLFSFEGNPSGLLLVFIFGIILTPSILIVVFLSLYTRKHNNNIKNKN